MFSQAIEKLVRITQRIGDRFAQITGSGIRPRYQETVDNAKTASRTFTTQDRRRLEHADDTPADAPVPPFEHATTTPRGLAPPRVWTVREYLHRFEQRTGRELTFEDVDTITRGGCVGVVAHYLGLTNGEMIPQHNVFADPHAHRVLALVENTLLHGDQSTAMIRRLRKLRTVAEEDHRLQQTAFTRDVLKGADEILKGAEKIAEGVLARMPGQFREQLLDYRVEVRKEGNWNTFKRVSLYEERLMHIFRNATDADVAERMMRDDRTLSQIPSLRLDLPNSPPDQWSVVTVHHRFWTGQDEITDREGLVGTPIPNPWAFTPNAETWQLDMTGDRQLAKPGGNPNFDFAVYEPQSKSWIGANNSIVQDGSPMRILQRTVDQQFTPTRENPAYDAEGHIMYVTDRIPIAR
ncbi:hypothetical protein [Nocardia sp. NPDC049149]|uniref:hypothetical protein n=1 Tax=Nocardia sp. NPDC049149 TaxID=3364315 RepID=UPI003717A556